MSCYADGQMQATPRPVSLPRFRAPAGHPRHLRRPPRGGHYPAPPPKKTACLVCDQVDWAFYDQRPRRARDLSCGDQHVYRAYALRRVQCRRCGGVKTERLDWLADKPFYAKRFAFFVGRRCRETPSKEVAEELPLDWQAVKELDQQHLQEQLRRAANPAPGSAVSTRSPSPRGTNSASGSATWSGVGRSGSAAGALRGEPGRLLGLVGPEQMRQNPPGGHGHGAGVPQRDPPGGPRAAGHDPVRQVPYPDAPGDGGAKIAWAPGTWHN